MIPIYKPYLPKKSLEYAHDALTSTWISSQGNYLPKVEESLKELLGVSYVQLVNNGTAATHLVSKGLLYKYPHLNKIFVPNNVYVAAWNSFIYDKEFYLHPIDADVNTWNFNTSILKNQVLKYGKRCAVLGVHNIGNIIDIPKLQKDLPKGTVIVEDNCEGFTGKYGEYNSGTQSFISSISFFGNKIITCGEGGAVVTNDKEVADYIKSVQGQGQSKDKRYVHDTLGYNYRMTNVQAAILLGQLEQLSVIKEKKEELFNYYKKELENIEGVLFQTQEEGTTHSNWMMGVRLVGSPSFETTSTYLKNKNIDTRPMFYPMSYHTHLKSVAKKDREEVASLLSKECVILPSFPDITKNERNHVVSSIISYSKDLCK